MIQSMASTALRQRIERANPATKATVLYLLFRTLKHAQRGNEKEAVAYLVAALVTLKFSYVWMFVEALLYANRARRRLKA